MADGNIDKTTIDAIEKQIKGFGDNIKALGDTTKTDLTEMRALIDAKAGKDDVVTEDRINKYAAAVETAQNAMETGLKEIRADVDKVATALNRTDGGWKGEDGAKAAQEAFEFAKAKMAKEGRLAVGAKIEPNHDEIKAWNENFGLYMRRDDKGSSPGFQAALQVGSDPDGGYLVPTETSSRIVTRVFETSPMRQVAYVESISGKELEVPRDDDDIDCGWVGETEARPETGTPQVGISKIPAHEMYASPASTQAMLEDAGINLEAWLARKVGSKFGRVEASAFYTGDGVNKPRGILTYAAGTGDGQIEQVVSGAATDFTFDGLKDLVFSLEDGYEIGASFMLHRLGVRNVSKLKDGEGRYLWEMSQKVGEPSQLLGYPVRRATDIAAPGAGALSAAFGNFAEGYTIVDRLGISTLRDPYSSKPKVLFYSRRRVGGGVVNFRAIKLQKLAAS
jgi:HK97 family phage major capsid protein